MAGQSRLRIKGTPGARRVLETQKAVQDKIKEKVAPGKRKRKGPHGVELKEKKKPKKCSLGTVYNAKLKKCVSNRKKGETLLEWQHRNTLESLTKPKKKGIA